MHLVRDEVSYSQHIYAPLLNAANGTKASQSSACMWKAVSFSSDQLAKLDEKLKLQKYAVWAMVLVVKYVGTSEVMLPQFLRFTINIYVVYRPVSTSSNLTV